MSEPDGALSNAYRQAARQDGALTYSQALDAGLTRARLRHLVDGGGWRSPMHGALVVPQAGDSVRADARAASLIVPGAVIGGLTAARLHGLGALPRRPPGEEVHLVVPRLTARTRRRGIALHWSNLLAEEVVEVDGMAVTSIMRTLVDLVLRRPREAAVAVLDAALHEGRITEDDLPSMRLMARGRAGTQRAAQWWSLADGRAESPLETRLRLLLLDAGLHPEEVQYTLTDAGGGFVARLDFAWPSRKVAVEADGETVHDQPDALYHDRWRQNSIVALGWSVLRYTWRDTSRPALLAADLRRHLA